MKKLVKKCCCWFISFFKWLLSQLKDKTTVIIFLILFAVAVSPIVLGYIFGFILKNNYFIGIATAYLLFWIAPGTPVFTVIIALTLAIRKLIKVILKKKEKVNDNL